MVSGITWNEPAMLHPQRPGHYRTVFTRISLQDSRDHNRSRGRHQTAAPNGKGPLRPIEEIAQARLPWRDRRHADRGNRPLERLDARRAGITLRPAQLACPGELQLEGRGAPHVRDWDSVAEESGVEAIDAVGERNRDQAVWRRHRALFPLQSGIRVSRERHGKFEQVFIIPHDPARSGTILPPSWLVPIKPGREYPRSWL